MDLSYGDVKTNNVVEGGRNLLLHKRRLHDAFLEQRFL
jgi:hypothetical protein